MQTNLLDILQKGIEARRSMYHYESGFLKLSEASYEKPKVLSASETASTQQMPTSCFQIPDTFELATILKDKQEQIL